MRITIATGPCLPAPPLRGGGMIRTWMALAAVFAEAGHNVTLLARAFRLQPRESHHDGFRIVRWGGYDQPRSTWISLIKDLRYAWGACDQLPAADILVTNDFWLPFFAPRLRPDSGRVVVSVNRFPKHQLGLYHRAALLVVPTRAIARAVETQAPEWVPRTTCIPNALDGRVFHPDDAVARDPLGILFAGRLHPEKGLGLLLDAFRELYSHLPGIRLTLAGPHSIAEGGGGPTYLRTLQKLASGLPVEFVGPVHQEASLSRLYQSHGVFCYPSLADQGETMGLAPLEAMACGCVPVVSSNPVFGDWLRAGTNGWSFDHHGTDPMRALAQRLHDSLAHPDRQAEMRHAAIASARRFEAREVAAQFLETFESLIDEAD
jgi:glycosyltransferase involved in cell wall biosynthesis